MYISNRRYPEASIDTQVSQHRLESKSFYRVCVTLDMILKVMAVTLLLIIAVVVAYKTLTPLPPLRTPRGG
jgi:hypothetical protein